MKYLYIVFICFFSHHFLLGQNEDPLNNWKDEIKNISTEEVDTFYYFLFRKKFHDGKYEEAVKFAEASYKAASTTGDNILKEKSCNGLALTYQILNDYENAFKFFDEAIKTGVENKLYDRLVYSYSNKAKAYLDNFKYALAAVNYIEALKYAEIVNNKKYIAIIYNELGLIDLRLGNYETALVRFNQSLDFKLENEIDAIIHTKYNIGLCYINLAKYSDAIEIFYAILYDFKEGNCEDCSISFIAGIYTEIGSAYLSLDEFKESKKNIFSALNLIQKDTLVDKKVLSRTYGYLFDLYKKEELIDSATYFLSKSLDFAVTNNDVKNIITNKLQFASIYEKEGNYAEALRLTNEANALKDSIFSADLVKKIGDAYVDFEKYNSGKVISRQGQTIQRSYNFLLMSGVILILLSIILALTYRALKYRREINKKLDFMVKQKTQELLNTNEELIHSRKELDSFLYRTSHDIRGPIATLMGLTKLARFEAKDEVMQNYLEKIEITSNKLNSVITRLTNVSQINSQPLEISDINIYQVVDEILKEIKPNRNISFRLTGDTSTPVRTDKILLKIILENLLDNSFKFIDTHETNPFVELNFRQNGNLELSVTDNGVGIDPKFRERVFELFFVASDKERGTGIGLYQTQLAIKKLEGKVELLLNKKPTSFTVIIPTNGKNGDVTFTDQAVVKT